MATQTTVLDLTKPAGNENALISVINGNMDKVDAEAGKVRGNVAADYSTSSAYAVGALCIHDGNLYSCNTAIGSGGEAWTAAHWTQVTIAGEIAGVAADIPEVVDNLTTTSSTKALSAGQGKALSDQISPLGNIVTDQIANDNPGSISASTLKKVSSDVTLTPGVYMICARCAVADDVIDATRRSISCRDSSNSLWGIAMPANTPYTGASFCFVQSVSSNTTVALYFWSTKAYATGVTLDRAFKIVRLK